MPAREGEELRYPTVEFVLHTVAGWINKHRANGGCDELGQCSPEEAIQMAKDLGVTVGDLHGLTAKGAGRSERVAENVDGAFCGRTSADGRRSCGRERLAADMHPL